MAFLSGYRVENVQGVPGQRVLVCEECGLILDKDRPMGDWEDHWAAQHGPLPARLNLRFRTRGGELYEMVPKSAAPNRGLEGK